MLHLTFKEYLETPQLILRAPKLSDIPPYFETIERHRADLRV